MDEVNKQDGLVVWYNERSAVIREILSIQRVQADSVPKNTAPG